MKNNDKSTNKGGLEKKLKTMAVVPVLIMGIVVTVLSYYVLLRTTQKEVERNLHNMAKAVALYYDSMYPGDYTADKENGRLLKGGVDISDTTDELVGFKEVSGMDFTVFYYDIRMISTLVEKDGKSIVYSVVNNSVSNAVINEKEEQFYDNIDVIGVKYFADYMPLYNSDGSVIGMIFAGKPTGEIEKESLMALFWIPVITICMTLIAGWISLVPARKIVDAILKEKKFLGEIAKGNLNAQIDASIVERKDELGEMGTFSRSVQKFIKEMIERDTLTRLYTRRIGESKINYVKQQLNDAGVKYCVCMGDIDFFKKVNDTYGHDAGDIVLRDVAHIFNENMLGHGFTVRWGGEEFLIIFEDTNIEKAYEILKSIREKVISHAMNYQDQVIKVTMTFGLVEGDERNINDIVKEADNLLYYGKQNGRNQIVTPEIVEKLAQDSGADVLEEK